VRGSYLNFVEVADWLTLFFLKSDVDERYWCHCIAGGGIIFIAVAVIVVVVVVVCLVL